MYKKSDLKTGMFGKMSNGWLFVIAGDVLVYDSGAWDTISSLDDNLTLCYSRHSIDVLAEVKSFDWLKSVLDQLDEGRGRDSTIIWERKPPKKIPTMKEVFLERNPNAPLNTNGIPKSCPHHIDKNWTDECFKHNCEDCWNRPVPNVEEVVE